MSAAACVSMFAVGGVEMSASVCGFSVFCFLLKRVLPVFPRLLLIVSKCLRLLVFQCQINSNPSFISINTIGFYMD
jgi:hypothetical protein